MQSFATPHLDIAAAPLHPRHILSSFVAGGIIGALTSTLFFPLNVVKARQMSQLGGCHPSTLSVLRLILHERDYKLAAMFRGVQLNFTRSMFTWAFTNTAYEVLCQYYAIAFG